MNRPGRAPEPARNHRRGGPAHRLIRNPNRRPAQELDREREQEQEQELDREREQEQELDRQQDQEQDQGQEPVQAGRPLNSPAATDLIPVSGSKESDRQVREGGGHGTRRHR
ncbi:hypothetical protein ABZW18_24935 [Streptomyces sp. NPDC004647]|uniref:hypothetical protein n=1 Tax=Streptomyces sp. NPDC004647 TaxID=3154671 RepID=UPI0033AD2429